MEGAQEPAELAEQRDSTGAGEMGLEGVQASRLSVGAKCRKMLQQECTNARAQGKPRSRRATLLATINLRQQLKESRSHAFLRRVRSRKLTKEDEITDSDSHYVPVDFGDTERMDMKRRMLMLLTRKAGPLTIFFDVRNLRYTIVPSALRSFNFLLLTAAYAATAATTRVGIWVVPDAADAPVSDDVTALLGMELLVTFTLVFYFGYCYNRFWEQYALAMACKGAIVNSVMLARSSRLARTELLDLYRFLNLAQAAGYVALSPVYTRTNLFDSFTRLHNLLPPDSKELTRINQHGLEGGRGAAVYNEYCLLALELVSHAAERGELSMAQHLMLQEAILKLRDSMYAARAAQTLVLVCAVSIAALWLYRPQRSGRIERIDCNARVPLVNLHYRTGLFNLHYTVIPFCYIHLVSFLVNAYLITFAMAKGRLFEPEADVARGCVFPALAAFFLSISCLGLIEIGGRMQNPVGNDAEDFAVLTFLNLTIEGAKQAMRTPETDRAKRHAKWRASQAVGTPPAAVLPRPMSATIPEAPGLHQA